MLFAPEKCVANIGVITANPTWRPWWIRSIRATLYIACPQTPPTGASHLLILVYHIKFIDRAIFRLTQPIRSLVYVINFLGLVNANHVNRNRSTWLAIGDCAPLVMGSWYLRCHYYRQHVCVLLSVDCQLFKEEIIPTLRPYLPYFLCQSGNVQPWPRVIFFLASIFYAYTLARYPKSWVDIHVFFFSRLRCREFNRKLTHGQ